MLIIYGALPVGGVETFFVRLLEYYFKQRGRRARLLLVEDRSASDQSLLERVKSVADVYFRSEIFHGNGFIAERTSLLSRVKLPLVVSLMKGATQIHVASGHHALLAQRLCHMAKVNLPITVGFYHSLEFAWGGARLPHFEKINRKFVLEHLPKKNLFMFSESTNLFYKRVMGVDLTGAKNFRLGVIDKAVPRWSAPVGPKLRIISIGRLVHFKSYNIWMLDVVAQLLSLGIDVYYSVYGTGPLEQEMKNRCHQLGIMHCVSFNGNLNYSEFDEIVLKYDVFVGSGTAVIQAASLGVPSIVGIESDPSPRSYGFFHLCADIDYNINEENLPLTPVKRILLDYLAMTPAEKKSLSKSQASSCDQFLMYACLSGFEDTIESHCVGFEYSKLKYVWSYLSTLLGCKLQGRNFYKLKRTPIANI